jgi:hypothetical protein
MLDTGSFRIIGLRLIRARANSDFPRALDRPIDLPTRFGHILLPEHLPCFADDWIIHQLDLLLGNRAHVIECSLEQ